MAGKFFIGKNDAGKIAFAADDRVEEVKGGDLCARGPEGAGEAAVQSDEQRARSMMVRVRLHKARDSSMAKS